MDAQAADGPTWAPRMCAHCGRMHGVLASRCSTCGRPFTGDGRTRRVAREAGPRAPREPVARSPAPQRPPLSRAPTATVLSRIAGRVALPELPRSVAAPESPGPDAPLCAPPPETFAPEAPVFALDAPLASRSPPVGEAPTRLEPRPTSPP